MTNRKNDKCIIYLNQGSETYRDKLTNIGRELSKSAEIVEKIKFKSMVSCIILNFLFSMKNTGFLIKFLRNNRSRNVFFDGLRPRNKQNSILFKLLYTLYYFLIANYLSSKIDTDSKNWVIIPDEAYGNALIACLCSRSNCTILINFTDTKNENLPYCDVFTFSSPEYYQYSDRKLFNLDNVATSNLHLKWVQNFFASLRNRNNISRSDWIGDLVKGNNLRDDTETSNKPIDKKMAVVVCGHVLADFPASRNWDYSSFEAWLDDILPKLKNRFRTVHYKPHPASRRYAGEEDRLSKLYKRKAFQGIDILSATDSIDLKSYSAVFSANGSVLIEASMQGASAFSSADGMTCRLPNVSFVRDVEEIDILECGADKKEFDMVKFAPFLFYWYCREFQNIREYGDWVCNLIGLMSNKSTDNMVYQYCDLDEIGAGLITHACLT